MRRAIEAFRESDRSSGRTDPDHDRALEQALGSRLTVITGGPGTGKTTVVVRIIACLLAENPDLVIAGSAPTGKASSNLEGSILGALPGMESGGAELARLAGLVRSSGIRCQTLQRWLSEQRRIEADVLVVDECSMMDLDLASRLFDALDPARTRVLLLGDKDQLAAVGPGSVFSDLSDKAGRLAGRPTHFKYGYAAGIEGYHWSADSSAEIKSGIVKKADTLDELAKMIRVPAENLKAQVARWNKDIKAGADTEFGRKIKKTGKSAFAGTDVPTLSAPLAEKGPYYAIECYPALLNTQGGPKRDAKARVMDVYNRPIPHLFVAGELGSIWGSIYQGSSNVCEALVYGQIAGASAAAEKPL